MSLSILQEIDVVTSMSPSCPIREILLISVQPNTSSAPYVEIPLLPLCTSFMTWSSSIQIYSGDQVDCTHTPYCSVHDTGACAGSLAEAAALSKHLILPNQLLRNALVFHVSLLNIQDNPSSGVDCCLGSLDVDFFGPPGVAGLYRLRSTSWRPSCQRIVTYDFGTKPPTPRVAGTVAVIRAWSDNRPSTVGAVGLRPVDRVVIEIACGTQIRDTGRNASSGDRSPRTGYPETRRLTPKL